MKKINKRWLIIGGVLIIIIGAVFIFGGGQKKEIGILVETSSAKPSSLVTTVSGIGKVTAANKAEIRAISNGLITQLHVEEGRMVKRGDLLISFDQQELQKAVENARSNLRLVQLEELSLTQSKIKLESTRKTHETSQTLYQDGAISKEQLEQASLTYNTERQQLIQNEKMVKLKIADARRMLANAQQDLRANQIYAPRSGMILSCPVKAGMTVTPGMELCQIGELQQLVIELPVNELDITALKLGQSATITQEGMGDQKISGKVIAIAPQAENLNNENVFIVKVGLDNSAGILRSGMSVDVAIVTHQLSKVLAVSLLAVTETEKNGKVEKYLYLIKENQAVKTKVTTGISNESEIEIKSGLKPGTTYISGDFETIQKLTDHAKIIDKNAPKVSKEKKKQKSAKKS